MAIDLTDRDLRTISVDGFGSVNEFESPTHVAKHDLIAISNMDVRNGKSLVSRLGHRYESANTIPLAVNEMLRYKPKSGQNSVIFRANDGVFQDTNDDRNFTSRFSITGTAWMRQYYDLVLFGSETRPLTAYDPVSGANPGIAMDGRIPSFLWQNRLAFVGTGGFISGDHFVYRFTFDIGIAGQFLGETGPCVFYDGISADVFYMEQADLTFTGTQTNIVKFLRPYQALVDAIPSYVQAINIYRSAPLAAAITDPKYDVQDDFTLFRVGSIPMSAMRRASDGALLFTDNGSVFGNQIRKSPVKQLPKAKSATFFKGRFWLPSPYVYENGAYVYKPDRVAFCANEANGTEPFVYFPESLAPVGSGETDEITLANWRGDALVAFKPNSMDLILGADDELDFGIPNISVKRLSSSIGLRSPKSLVDTEFGLVWESNRGPYIYDGTFPRPLSGERVKRTFKSIAPARRGKSVGIYHTAEREYIHYHSLDDGSSGSSQYNRHYAKYNWFTEKWTFGVQHTGVGAAVEVKDAADDYVLLGSHDSAFNSRALLRLDGGLRDGVGPVFPQAPIPFFFQTSFLDDGRPFEDKMWQAIILETNTQIPLTVDILVDNRYDSRHTNAGVVLTPPAATGSLVWGQGNWGEKKWASSPLSGSTYRAITEFGDTIPVGKAASFIISGSNTLNPVEVYSLTVFYKSAGVRPNED